MKKTLGLAILVFLVSLASVTGVTAQARMVEPPAPQTAAQPAAPAGAPTQADAGWSWTSVKQKVIQTVSAWWHGSKNGQPTTTTTTQAPTVATTQPTEVVPSGHAGSITMSGPVTVSDSTDRFSWNPFKRFFASTKTDETPSTRHSVGADVNMKNVGSKINSLNVTRTAQAAVPFKDKNLIVGHNGIPVFEFRKFNSKMAGVKVRKIPLLNLGTEEVLDSKAFDLVNVLPFPDVPFEPAKQLSGPAVASTSEFIEMLGGAVIPTAPAIQIEVPVLQPEQKVTAEKISKLIYVLTNDIPVNLMPVTQIAEEDLKL